MPPFAEDTRDCYRLKDITFFGSRRRVLLQSANGPCPLLALCNVLLLRNQLNISQDARYVSFGELVGLVGNALFETNASATTGADLERVTSSQANVRESANACLEILPRLNVGLDVNCKFAGPSQFEYTRELAIFDLFDVGLYHGWVVSREDEKTFAAIADLSYNLMVEKVIEFQEVEQQASIGTSPATAHDPTVIERGRLIVDFMDRTATQLTYEGIAALREEVRERQLVVFYRNGHFSTMLRYEGALYLLCTDLGYSTSAVVWERLDEVNGDTTHYDAGFQVSNAESGEAASLAAAMAMQAAVYAGDFGGDLGGSGGHAQGGGMADMSEEDRLLAMQLMQEDSGAQPGLQLQPPPEGDEDAQLAYRLMQEDLASADRVASQAAA